MQNLIKFINKHCLKLNNERLCNIEMKNLAHFELFPLIRKEKCPYKSAHYANHQCKASVLGQTRFKNSVS